MHIRDVSAEEMESAFQLHGLVRCGVAFMVAVGLAVSCASDQNDDDPSSAASVEDPASASIPGGADGQGQPLEPSVQPATGPGTAQKRLFTAITAGSYHSCGIEIDKTVACWGEDDSRQAQAPEGEFSAITAGNFHTCGIRVDRTVTCWGIDHEGETQAPEGEFTAITAGRLYTCGIRTDKTVACWGKDDSGQTQAPEGEFSAITAGDSHACGIRTDQTGAIGSVAGVLGNVLGTAVCWGTHTGGAERAPQGQFTAITAGHRNSCGIRVDKTVICWGIDHEDETQVPEGEFTAIAAGGEHECGIRTDQTVVCWGIDRFGQTQAP